MLCVGCCGLCLAPLDPGGGRAEKPSVWKLDVACCCFVPWFYEQVWEEASGSMLLPALGNSGSAGSQNPRGIH